MQTNNEGNGFLIVLGVGLGMTATAKKVGKCF